MNQGGTTVIYRPSAVNSAEGLCFFYQDIKNLSSQESMHVFSAISTAVCVKNSCRATAQLQIFALTSPEMCLKIHTYFL
jgi:hypothetical protein